MSYSPTRESLASHEAPDWFHDAKLGIFVHWGLYSVPGWATTEGDLHRILGERGASYWFSHNSYAEWYWNSLKLEGSPTQSYHHEEYGEGFPYQDFAPVFNQAVAGLDFGAWGKLFGNAGARYAVLTTKHHDGFLLWDSAVPNPYEREYQAVRDLVGEFCSAMRSKGLRAGLYYSGGLDWTFDPRPIEFLTDVLAFVPSSQEYASYVDAHWRELIDRYQPDILWNDIAYPPKGDLLSIVADYYNGHPDGLVNDRFGQIDMQFIGRVRLLRVLLNKLAELMLRRGEGLSSDSGSTRSVVWDYMTPEYTVFEEIKDFKWETCRGMAKSFGYNQNDEEQDLVSVDELVHMLVDIVSKNGNLLLNVGPRADGSIPEMQRNRLEGLGQWLEVNGEAVFDTRPWLRAEGVTEDGLPLRFTCNGDVVYAISLGRPAGDSLVFPFDGPEQVREVGLLGDRPQVEFTHDQRTLRVKLPSHLPPSPSYAFRIR
jgi:alpha-L-fucosidase